MSEEEERAGRLQFTVRSDEYDRVQDYGKGEVRQAIVHSRQDIVLIYSMLCSAVKILKGIRVILGSMLFLFVIYFLLSL